MYLLQVFTLF